VEVERLGGSEGRKEVGTEEGMERPPQCESTTDYTFSILFPSLTNQVEAYVRIQLSGCNVGYRDFTQSNGQGHPSATNQCNNDAIHITTCSIRTFYEARSLLTWTT